MLRGLMTVENPYRQYDILESLVANSPKRVSRISIRYFYSVLREEGIMRILIVDDRDPRMISDNPCRVKSKTDKAPDEVSVAETLSDAVQELENEMPELVILDCVPKRARKYFPQFLADEFVKQMEKLSQPYKRPNVVALRG